MLIFLVLCGEVGAECDSVLFWEVMEYEGFKSVEFSTAELQYLCEKVIGWLLFVLKDDNREWFEEEVAVELVVDVKEDKLLRLSENL